MVTDSQNNHTFLRRGSKKGHIQRTAFAVKKLELKYGITIIPVWVEREEKLLQVADEGSKLHLSSDEWSIGDRDFKFIEDSLGVKFDVDAFASEENARCAVFFSKIPQIGGAGVNFFAQGLDSDKTYWACPPVDLVGPTFLHLKRQKNVKAVLAFPVWKSSNFWSIVVKNDELPACVSKFVRFRPKYYPSNNKVHQVFAGKKKFDFLAILIETGVNVERLKL